MDTTTLARPAALTASNGFDGDARFEPDRPEPTSRAACSRSCGPCWITWTGTDHGGAWLCETAEPARELAGANR